MTDEKARLTLDDSEAWIDWDEAEGKPLWAGTTIGLNGYFTANQLLAILHFAPAGTAMADDAELQAINNAARRPN